MLLKTIKVITKKQKSLLNLKGGHVIRSHSFEDNVYAAIDTVIDKLERQLRKFKTRIYNRIHRGKSIKTFGFEEDLNVTEFEVPDEIAEDVKDYSEPKIIKTKRFKMEPMDPQDAS